jgi:serine/threonine protein kinase
MLVFGRVKPLGFGAESTVFPAAIKIKNDPGDAKREYTMHRMCASAYVVPVEYLEIARAIVMPAATMDLFAFLETNATIEPDELWRIVRHMSAAVAAVHRACVVHRDVKLENFMCFEEPCGESDDEEAGEADDDEADRREEGEADDEEAGEADDEQAGEADRREEDEPVEADRMEEGGAGEADESDDEEEEEPNAPKAPEEEPQKAPEEEDRREEDRSEEDRRNQGEAPKAPKAPKAPNAVRTNAVRQISSTRMVVKLTDFGFATKLEEGAKLTATQGTRVGTIPYVAPEIVDFAPYDAKADVWSLGVCVFMVLTKCAPFSVCCGVSGYKSYVRYGTFAKGVQKRWSERSKSLSGKQRAVVTRALTVDQDKRASSKAISRAATRCI